MFTGIQYYSNGCTTMKQLLKQKWREHYLIIGGEGVLTDSSHRDFSKAPFGTDPSKFHWSRAEILKDKPVEKNTGLIRGLLKAQSEEWEMAKYVEPYHSYRWRTLVLAPVVEKHMKDYRDLLNQHYSSSKDPVYKYLEDSSRMVSAATITHITDDLQKANEVECFLKEDGFYAKSNWILSKRFPNRVPPLVTIVETDPRAAYTIACIVEDFGMEAQVLLVAHNSFKVPLPMPADKE